VRSTPLRTAAPPLDAWTSLSSKRGAATARNVSA
jgi:hypothetical protein